MSTHKHIDIICALVTVVSLLLTVLFMNGSALGLQRTEPKMGYEDRLFDTSAVHTIDIVIDDWDAFLSTAEREEYSLCSLVIDGETVQNVGIRGKGNTSLSTVAGMDSDRYSFKIEFDQYDSSKSYYGLDKLCLNNLIQDNTYMKDYLVYQMMAEFGVAAPLCSYAYLTVNGEDWGLYLAVEGVEDAFLQRNYGSDHGELYKPDSMNFGGGRGNGKDFDISDFLGESGNSGSFPRRDGMSFSSERGQAGDTQPVPDITLPGGAEFPEDMELPDGMTFPDGMELPEGFELPEATAQQGETPSFDRGGMNFGFGGMGSSDVKLQYIDDNAESYSNIFSSAKTEVSEADQQRLIASLKQLSSFENLSEVVDTESVLRYFVVHNFVVNGDSYTGSMIHNYYLYEEDGQLSMIPWDYNLAFGTFQGGSAASAVNGIIDEVLSDRPMQAWIFSDESYAQQYEALYAQLIAEVDVQDIIQKTAELIAPYVAQDPTAFCTYGEFQTGVSTLKEFCRLRTESVSRQLDGNTESVDPGNLVLSDMGTMSMGGGRGDRQPGFPDSDNSSADSTADETPGQSLPGGMEQRPGSGQRPDSRSTEISGVNSSRPSGDDMSEGFPGMTVDADRAGTSSGTGAASLICASLAFLLIGLAIVFKYRR